MSLLLFCPSHSDFDLEAEIATLPPCSLDQVGRRRPPRKRSDSESGRKQPSPASAQGGPSSPSDGQCGLGWVGGGG